MDFELEPKNFAQAIKLAKEIERLEATVKCMKDNFKTFVKEYGAVETDFERWDFYPSVSWAFDKENTKEIARTLILEGTDPWELIKFAPKDLISQGWNEESLAQFGSKKVTNRFTSRKL
ncbi:hypothetical protein ACQKM9_20060 [Viridibacillus sp. NPDC093762]|uniref:hypothetical protein n=1 Tax=Viridibacillus sp. NPDC093762 TaxID=3390720 RepID=UPI003CFF57A4